MPDRPTRAVAVTGAGSAVGAALVRALAADPGTHRVVAVHDAATAGALPAGDVAQDVARDVAHVEHLSTDLTSPDVARLLARVDAVVHVAVDTDLEAALARQPGERRERAVGAARAVTTAAAAVGAASLVAVTSAMVLGALPDAPVPLREDAPLRAVPDDGLVGDLLAVEEVLERARSAHPGTQVAVLRPAALVGPGVDTVITRHFEAPRLLTLRDSPSLWQFCHVDDVASAVLTALDAGLSGPLTVAATGVLTQQALERASGMRRVELPSRLALATAERLSRLAVVPMPAGDLAYVVHPWVVGSERLLASGWTPAHDNTACLAVLLEQVAARRARPGGLRVTPREAALGAAGAAVALVGTAALLRQARARRRARP